ncbi:hypothetical protein ABZ942_25840 [Nocardia sp. NPDC046473]|uniref:Imm8 family immunity protein n=1 Tax=Nocardia sp. NPDC046473 TaxID=3155733 RepID=UPI0033FA8824
MKAELKRIHSPDANLEKGPLPSDALFVQLMIGLIGGSGEESFDLVVCTPEARVCSGLGLSGLEPLSAGAGANRSHLDRTIRRQLIEGY